MPMPSEAWYREMVAGLKKAKKALDAAEDDRGRLEAALAAQRAMIHFLDGDLEILDNFLSAPLAVLENAAHDAWRGASVALFEHKPPDDRRKPTEVVSESTMGLLAAALEMLRVGKMGPTAPPDGSLRWRAG
jgi:hypothetical protein